MCISRAAPEQEPPTSERNMQPIVNGNCVLVHNGSVTQQIYDELMESEKEFKWTTDIDSEAIIAAYIKHRSQLLIILLN